MKTELIVLSPVLQCHDIKETVAFYTGKMGFKLCFKDSADDDYTYAGVCREGIEIHFQQPDPEYISQADHQPGLRIKVKGIDAIYQEYKQAGIVTADLGEKPWGTKEFGLYDPNKASIHFYEDLSPGR